MEADLKLYSFLDGKHWAEEFNAESGLDISTLSPLFLLMAKERYPTNVDDFMRGVKQCMKQK